jgi:alpha-mannosidase
MKLSERITALSTHIATLMKAMAVSIDKKAEKENWFTLVSGYLSVEDLAPIPTGEVLKYTYQGGAIRYRFIANDDSEDSFYLNYSNGVFSGLVATKKITI